MFHIDFARIILHDIDEALAGRHETVWNCQDFPTFREMVGYRNALVAMRAQIVKRLGDDGAELVDIGL
jgi:hypothetical protein